MRHGLAIQAPLVPSPPVSRCISTIAPLASPRPPGLTARGNDSWLSTWGNLPLATTFGRGAHQRLIGHVERLRQPKGQRHHRVLRIWDDQSLRQTRTGTLDIGSGSASVRFREPITGLAPSRPSTGHRAVATVGTTIVGTVYGDDRTFATLATPAIETTSKAYLGASGAEVSQTVNPNGVGARGSISNTGRRRATGAKL